MKVLGRELVPPFDTFWDGFSPEIPVPVDRIVRGDSAIVGGHGHQDGSGELADWMRIPDGALSYHVAHELTHLVLRQRGYPGSVRGPQYAEESPEARVGSDLEEMVSHHALEELLKDIPFDRAHIQQHLYDSARLGLEGSPVPSFGTSWWITWAIRFCELQFQLPEPDWLRLEVVYDGRCPGIADEGRELSEIMRWERYHTPDRALQAMIDTRDALGLKDAERCLVLDLRDGKLH